MSHIAWGTQIPGSHRGRRSGQRGGWYIAAGLLGIVLAVALALQLAVRDRTSDDFESSAEARAMLVEQTLPEESIVTIPSTAPASPAAPSVNTAVVESPPALFVPDVTVPSTSASLDASAVDVPYQSANNEAVLPDVPSPAPLTIRSVDLASIPAVSLALQTVGGRLDASTVRFVDLTGDGADEALVPISSGGTLGDVAYFVVSVAADRPQVIFEMHADPGVRNASRVFIESGQLVEVSPQYLPTDALCCPAAVQQTRYVWNGQTFTVRSRELIESTPAK